MNDIKRYIIRRYSFDELESILNQKLNNQSRNLKHYADKSLDKFMNIVVYSITDEILEQLTDGWVEDSPIPEKGLYEFIEELFGERIIKKYDELRSMNLQETIRTILREESNPKQDLYYEFKCTDADRDGIFYDTCFGEIDSTEFAQFINDMENYEISEEEFKDKFTLTKSINKIINNPESEEWLEFYDKSEEDGYVVIFDGDIHYIYSV